MAACLALSCSQGSSSAHPQAMADEEEEEDIDTETDTQGTSPAPCSRSQKLLRSLSQKLRTLNSKDICKESDQKKKNFHLYRTPEARADGLCKGSASMGWGFGGKKREPWQLDGGAQKTAGVQRQERWSMASYFGMDRGKDRIKDGTKNGSVVGLEIEEDDEDTEEHQTQGCFGFYGDAVERSRRCGGLKSQGRIKPSAAQGLGESPDEIQEWEEGEVTATCVGCFRAEREGLEIAGFWKNENIRAENSGDGGGSDDQQPVLPDDILEMCLARAPLPTLMQARAVCKKWRSLTLSPHFLQLRAKIPNRKPWLFLFGLSRDGVCIGQIQGLDPTSDKWFSINAENLTGRLLYSVTAIGSSIYVLGGCSSTDFPKRPEKAALRTHKTLLIYNVLTGQWRKGCSMSVARSTPIVGVFEIKDKHFSTENQELGGVERARSQQTSDAGRRFRSRRTHDVEVFGGYQSFRSENALCQSRIASGESQEIWRTHEKPGLIDRHDSLHSIASTFPDGCWQTNGSRSSGRLDSKRHTLSELKRYGLIVVGGQGCCNEPLESAEIYDSLADRWIKIASWPIEYGNVCSGVVCKGMFFAYSETDKLAAYDFDAGVWIEITVSGIPPRLYEYLPKLIACNERMFLIGVAWPERAHSAAREKASRKLWELSEAGSGRAWVEVSQHPDAPLDWNAVFVAHEERVFGVEMFKIFGQVLDFVTVCDVSSLQIKWERVSRRQMSHYMDASSCLTKTAVVVQL